MSSFVHKLVGMAQQIADNNSFTPDEETVAAKVAEHIQKFWDPRMKAKIIEHAGSHSADMSSVVRLAVSKISIHT